MTALRAAMLIVTAAPVALACGHESGPGSENLSSSKDARWPAGQVICLEYLGPSDRSVPPVILAAKSADVDAFLRTGQGKKIHSVARRVVASRQALDCAQGHLPSSATSAQDPLLSVKIWREKSSYEARLAGQRGVELLKALQACLQRDSAEAASELNGLITFIRMEMERPR
ncbi:MAG: hypothetical protein KatS3mg024_2315 [Armatimonadota bacterium]|nr:MAG: hypothetical protein KatS3mg024_2315 [Armatimonadota bacterium]